MAEDKKRIAVAKRLAVERLETVLNSLAEISSDAHRPTRQEGRNKMHRLFVTTVVATEAEEKDR
jgi:hypothetical protein